MITHGARVTIDYEGETPLWRQLAEILRGQMTAGEYGHGARLPSDTTWFSSTAWPVARCGRP